MAVFIGAISVVIPVSRLEESYPGGVEGYERDCPNQTFLRDEHLTRVGFMSPRLVERFVDGLTEATSLRFRDGDAFADIAVIEANHGPLAHCSWLEYGRHDWGVDCCWLHGTDPGPIRIPVESLISPLIRLSPEQEERLVPLPPEHGIARNYDPESGKILYTTLVEPDEADDTAE